MHVCCIITLSIFNIVKLSFLVSLSIVMHQYLNNNNNDPSQMNYHDPTSVTSSGMTVPYNSPPTGAVPHRSHNASRDYEQHSSPPSAMNAITMASSVLSGEDEGLEACTATAAISGLCRRPSIKEESYCLPNG